MMKHNKNSSNSWYVGQHGSSSARDGSSSLVCDHRSALKEMAREQSLVTQLRAVVLPELQADDERSEVVAQMFASILDCSARAIAALKLHDAAPRAVVVDDRKRARKVSDDNAKPQRQRKRRRLADDSVTLETPVPHYDGHQWRKYGQKRINNTEHPRSYYKCTYGQEQDCRATKTVQQQQEDGRGGNGGASSADDPVMYAVIYYGQHTCKCKAGNTDVVVETASTGHSDGEHAQSRIDSQRNNISVTCTSVIVDVHHSLESKLLDMDMAEDHLTTAEANKYEMFDMAAYAALDFDMLEMDVDGLLLSRETL